MSLKINESHEKHRIEVALIEVPEEERLFRDYKWEVTFQCPYCESTASTTFNEKLLRRILGSPSVVSYRCECPAWTGFHVDSLPEPFASGSTFIIRTHPPQKSP